MFSPMALDRLLVLLGGLLAIAWVNWYFLLARRSVATAPPSLRGQEITIRVEGGYDPAEVHVRAGTPVRLIFDRRETSSCSEELVLPDFQIRRFLPPHQKTVVEFTPPKPGVYEMSCGMGMLHGKVVVE